MRITAILSIAATLAVTGPALADDSGTELLTVQNAILCMNPDNLRTANHPTLVRRPFLLRAMGCIRIGSGIRSRLINRTAAGEPWQVRFYPEGISTGVVLWGLPSAFAVPSGAQLPTMHGAT
jgi:hypothetical protein